VEVVVLLSSRIGIFVNGSFTFNVVDSKEEDDDVKSSLAFFILTFDGNCLWMIGWNDFLGKKSYWYGHFVVSINVRLESMSLDLVVVLIPFVTLFEFELKVEFVAAKG